MVTIGEMNVLTFKIAAPCVSLLSLDQALAAQVLGHLPRELAERASLAVAEIGEVTQEQQQAVLIEFKSQFHGQPRLRRGGPESARQLLAQTFGHDEAAPIQTRVEQTRDAGPFAFLTTRHADDIRPLLMEESPQVIAAIGGIPGVLAVRAIPAEGGG